MRILVIDAQGGGVGRQLITAIRKEMPDADITAVGTNSTATGAMLKAGADRGATGENAVIAGCRKAEVIIGPIGITIPDAMLGEVTPEMALAVARCPAKRILIPFRHEDYMIVGVAEYNVGKLVQLAVEELLAI